MVLGTRMAQVLQVCLAVITGVDCRLVSAPTVCSGEGDRTVLSTAPAWKGISLKESLLNLPTVFALLKGYSYYFLPLRTFVHRTHPVR